MESQSTCCTCQVEWNRASLDIEWHTSLEINTVIHNSKTSGSSFWSIFTLTWSSMGVAVYAASLALLILTALLFAEWRRTYKNQLLIQFMLARFLYTSVRFFSDIQRIMKVCSSSKYMVFLDVYGMIYSEMTLVAWMFVFSRQMYKSLVKVFNTESTNIWKVSLWTWLCPAAVALLLNILMYVLPDTFEIYFIMYLLLMKWPMLISNAVLLILILRSLLLNNKKRENNIRIVLVILVMLFMFCVQQMLIDACKLVYYKKKDKLSSSIVSGVLIFGNIFTIYHSAFSTVFWVLGNANTRKLWKFQHLRGKIRRSITSSSCS